MPASGHLSRTLSLNVCPVRFTHAANAYRDDVKEVSFTGILLIALVIKGNLNAHFILTISERIN